MSELYLSMAQLEALEDYAYSAARGRPSGGIDMLSDDELDALEGALDAVVAYIDTERVRRQTAAQEAR